MAQVKAPDTLWTGIQAEHRRRRTEIRHGWILWPAVAFALLLASGDLLWEIGKARGDVIRLSDREISRLDSRDPVEIRDWVRSETGMDVNLSCGQTEKARMFGVRLLRVKNELVAAISYGMESGPATLLVSRKGLAIRRMEPSTPDSRLVSWNSRERSFAIAVSHGGDSEASCTRCHLDGHGQL
jgi:hypothetical protein